MALRKSHPIQGGLWAGLSRACTSTFSREARFLCLKIIQILSVGVLIQMTIVSTTVGKNPLEEIE